MAIDPSDVFAAIRRGPQKMYNPAAVSTTDLPNSKKRTRQQSAQSNGNDHTMGDGSSDDDAAGLSAHTPDDSAGNIPDSADAESDKEMPACEVFEPTTALRPKCYKTHGGFKGKGRQDEPKLYSFSARLCGKHKSCPVAVIDPPTAKPGFYRLNTNDPEHDVERWLLTLNLRLGGGFEDRESSEFLDDERITQEHLADALRLAIVEIQYEHERMEHLAEFADRHPYRVNLLKPLADADEDFLRADPKIDLTAWSRNELVETLKKAAMELDYLRGVTEGIGKKILIKKKQLAKLAYQVEQETLMRAGYVDQEWVDKECFFF